MKGWRIRPTAFGLGYLVMLLILLLVAVNYSNNLLFTLSFLLVSAMLLSLWSGLRNLTGFSVSQVRVRPVHAGQPLTYELSVQENRGQQHLYLQLQADNQSSDCLHIEDLHQQSLLFSCQTHTRGLQPTSAVQVFSRWPLGLFHLARPLTELPETLVYPAAQAAAAIQHASAGQAAQLQTEAEELAGLKAYQPGDNLRRILWRAYSKGQGLQVKEFDGADGDPSLWLRWQDYTAQGYEARIEALCADILGCQKRGQAFGLELPGISLSPERDGHHIGRCLTQLALLPAEGTADQDRAASKTRAQEAT